MPSPATAVGEIYRALKPGGVFYIAGPKGHATSEDFQESIANAEGAGFSLIAQPKIRRDYTAVFRK